jgi:sucrose synthase
MARLDQHQEHHRLVDWYGRSPELREGPTCWWSAGMSTPDRSGDDEEREQIERMHHLMDQHGLDGQVRWLGQVWKSNWPASSTAHRRPRGGFVQPALFEAFGLTVIEAMACGLPTFATCYGGPLEIIEDGVSGFHIDPNHGDRRRRPHGRLLPPQLRRRPEHWDKHLRAPSSASRPAIPGVATPSA